MKELPEVLTQIPLYQLGLINGKLLGDGNLSIEKNKSPRLRFQHRIPDKDWCIFCYNSLKDVIPLSPPKYKKDIDARVKAGYSESFYVQSKTSPVLTFLRDQWYNVKIKMLPIDLLYSTLTPESLAWWYQDDGHLLTKGNLARKIILSTDNFTPNENMLLIELLKEIFKLQFSLDGQNRLCLYDQRQILYFFHLISDHIHPSMIRKQLPTFLEITPPTAKRTTVYLPFTLSKPTEEIRNKLNSLIPDLYIKNWFSHYKVQYNEPKNTRYGHQVLLRKEELLKVLQVQKATGLTMSEIISSLFLKQRGLSSWTNLLM